VNSHFQAKHTKYSNSRIIKITAVIPTSTHLLVVPKCTPQIQDSEQQPF